MSEILAGIRVIKYFNWQEFFTDRINAKRKEELKYLAGNIMFGPFSLKLSTLAIFLHLHFLLSKYC